jgi:hypothetical protein
MKDVDSTGRSFFLKTAARAFPTIGFLGLMTGGLLVGMIAEVLGTIICFFIVETLNSGEKKNGRYFKGRCVGEI